MFVLCNFVAYQPFHLGCLFFWRIHMFSRLPSLYPRMWFRAVFQPIKCLRRNRIGPFISLFPVIYLLFQSWMFIFNTVKVWKTRSVWRSLIVLTLSLKQFFSAPGSEWCHRVNLMKQMLDLVIIFGGNHHFFHLSSLKIDSLPFQINKHLYLNNSELCICLFENFTIFASRFSNVWREVEPLVMTDSIRKILKLNVAPSSSKQPMTGSKIGGMKMVKCWKSGTGVLMIEF